MNRSEEQLPPPAPEPTLSASRLWRRTASFQRCLGLILLLAGCTPDAEQTPVGATTMRGDESTPQVTARTHHSSRRATRWSRLSPTELGAEIDRAGGRAFVGFRAEDGGPGVDEVGTVRASGARRRAGLDTLAAVGVTVIHEYRDVPAVVARLTRSQALRLLESSVIEYVEPIFPGRALAQDTSWNVWRVDAPAAWATATGSGVKVLVADWGADTTATDIAWHAVLGCDGTNGIAFGGHGLNVAGVLGASANSINLIGTAHGAAIISARIGANYPYASPAAVACAIELGRDSSVAAINLSLHIEPYTTVTDQINQAYFYDDIVVVAAAGNDTTHVLYPASLYSVIAVGATSFTSTNSLASFSVTGPQIELVAPGSSIPTLAGYDSIEVVHGTSFAAPHVTGAAAILRSANSGWSAPEIRRRLAVGAEDLGASGRDNSYGWGLLKIAAALSAAAPSPPSVSIDGPTLVKPFVTCVWSPSINGGVSPFTYDWHGYSTQEYLSYANTSNHGERINLWLTVTGADLASSTVHLAVDVDNNAPTCPF